MDALFDALSQYIDFLVLGAVAFAAVRLPFQFKKPLTEGWKWLRDDLVGQSQTLTQVGLITGILFATFYFSGYLLNAIGISFLHRAHYSVIDFAATAGEGQKAETSAADLEWNFVWRTVPLVGAFIVPPRQSELDNYRRDASRQVYWDVCDPHSSDDMLGGGILKELRLLRGMVGLSQILFLACIMAFGLSFTTFNYTEKQRHWSAITFAFTFILYALFIIPGYWDIEYEEHSTIWAVFPPNLESVDTR